ncbi:NADH:ubiquinone reductase (Na(+)-transporting) subunit B [Ancylomarina euxinus]|uniref:Na(+)-translocating NADH-quinone reductase subunit B n=1 Tax=Ancylomarina euxinus TaxID=2283627 RepID=A0A425XXY1_9BACT|nr:NADH:ubiquinone reductase (Na(+)-transporting) subunit B [Ancylomarina euxinus]MCZ4695862.1 NADH:ubiquinone reductase (Na(+)-transporting) subunit B [Ancylomarina euxinus]MUP16237.1 NADH:ubiquinone reductase (Na(+)-transporting) subunit B [Ancylomarina euxinus]RRG19607.1 NADH:ubiquinone reductase (Na(+)-transporting) subunit B [Ancylomarina euxinus]
MKALRKFLDKKKPLFQKGGKFAKLQSSFEAFETFLYVPNITSHSGTHIKDAIDLKRTMSVVVLALIPALLFGIYNTGYQHFLSLGKEVLASTPLMDICIYGLIEILPIIVVSYVVGLGIEFAFAQMRGHQVNEGFLVSGMLIPLIMPVGAPLWMVAVSTAFAVVIGKEVFGGTGMNIWNPALVARAFFFFAYPSKMSGDIVWIADKADSFSGATPLAHAATLVDATGEAATSIYTQHLSNVWDMFVGLIPGSIGETSTIAILIGAVILIASGIGSWKIMASVFVGGYTMGAIFNLVGANAYMELIPAWQHLIMGGFAFGAVFMATDPVSAAQTARGKIIYGFLIGFLAVLIRVMNAGFPEAMMLAILLMNTFAPLIDHYVIQGNIKRRLKRVKVNA